MPQTLLKKKAVQNRNWLHIPDFDLTIGVAPKCGSSSIRAALSDVRTLPPATFSGRCIWIVREPVSRFMSLWDNKARDGHKLSEGHQRALLDGMSMDEVMNLIQSGTVWNHHWATQTELEGGHSTELVPLPKLNEWWAAEGLPAIEHHNVTTHKPAITSTINIRVLAHYREDSRMYWHAYRNFTRVSK